MNDQIGQHYLEDALHTFRDYRKNAERACAQTRETDFLSAVNTALNSIPVTINHMFGNMFWL